MEQNAEIQLAIEKICQLIRDTMEKLLAALKEALQVLLQARKTVAVPALVVPVFNFKPVPAFGATNSFASGLASLRAGVSVSGTLTFTEHGRDVVEAIRKDFLKRQALQQAQEEKKENGA